MTWHWSIYERKMRIANCGFAECESEISQFTFRNPRWPDRPGESAAPPVNDLLLQDCRLLHDCLPLGQKIKVRHPRPSAAPDNMGAALRQARKKHRGAGASPEQLIYSRLASSLR